MKNFFINIFLIFFGLSFNYAQDGVGINIESPKAIFLDKMLELRGLNFLLQI